MKDLSATPWNAFPLDAAPNDLVSPNFRFRELTLSDTAARLNLDNSFVDEAACHAAVYLCRRIMEPVRARFGPFSPNSVFRSQNLERALKKMPADWSSDSQHTRGQACDIVVPGVANMELATWIVENLAFDQVILECHNAAKGKNSGWVHVSIVPRDIAANRGNLLSYVMDANAGKFVYVQGLQETA